MARIAAQPAPRARNNRWMIIGAIAFGLLTAYLVVRYVSAQTHAQTVATSATVPVVVAKQDIAPATAISADMVELKHITPDVAVKTAFAQTDKAVGQRVRYAIPTGAQIVPGMLVQAGSADALSFVVPPGKRAVAVATSDVIGSGNHVLPGDFVDVMVIMGVPKLVGGAPLAGGQDLQGVATLLQNIQVLAVADQSTKAVDAGPGSQNAGPGSENAKPGSSPNLAANGSVTLAVDPSQAQLLFLAETEGKIRLALRPFGDQQVQPVPAALEPLANAAR